MWDTLWIRVRCLVLEVTLGLGNLDVSLGGNRHGLFFLPIPHIGDNYVPTTSEPLFCLLRHHSFQILVAALFRVASLPPLGTHGSTKKHSSLLAHFSMLIARLGRL